ncbi:hypothetical protein K2Y00_00280 [Patescibacteria group bacterium]|nr:hypothetical protein [Patescibacteria group bacterium]
MKLSLFAFASVLLLAPFSASAATPSCMITVFTPRGTVEITTPAQEVTLQKDEVVMFMWNGQNAQRATDKNGNVVPVFGMVTVPTNQSVSYSYDFIWNNDRATCGVSFISRTASIDLASITKKPEKPTIRGTADTKSVTVTIKDEEGDQVYKKTAKVTKGVWKASVTKKLVPGSYDITLTGKEGRKLNTLTSASFTVPEKGSSKTLGAVSISQVPLLMGGNATPGSSIPVSYIKLVNTSKEMAQIKGFELIQNGSASTDVIIGFSTNDDKGGSRTTIGGSEGFKAFKGSKAYVPLEASLSPGQIRIFTIKALISRNSGLYAGKNLMLDVASVDTNAAVKGTFPIRGTAFTLTR